MSAANRTATKTKKALEDMAANLDMSADAVNKKLTSLRTQYLHLMKPLPSIVRL